MIWLSNFFVMIGSTVGFFLLCNLYFDNLRSGNGKSRAFAVLIFFLLCYGWYALIAYSVVKLKR